MEPEIHPIQSDRLLRVVANCLGSLIESGEFLEKITHVLGHLGSAVNVDRVYLFENHLERGKVYCSQRAEWAREGVAQQLQNSDLQNLPFEEDFPDMFAVVSRGKPFTAFVASLESPLREFLLAQDIMSIAMVPFFCHGSFGGFIGFDDCKTERIWDEVEMDSLRALAAGIGSACLRERTERSIQARADELARSRRVALSLIEDSQNALQAAEEANRAKSSFLAMMSHEIRTPLNGVIGFTEILLHEKLSPPQIEMLETIRNCGDSLLNLISDILDLSKVESGKIDLDVGSCSLRECVREVIQSFGAVIQGKNVGLEWEVAPSVPETVFVDGKRLRQILVNLVGNAIKFTDQGLVSVRLDANRDSSGELILTGTVTDTGIGMSAEELGVIFEAFRQAHSSIHRQFGGSGLGLAICRRFVEAMGGKISAQSEPGKGTTLTFGVPVRVADSVEDTLAPSEPVAPPPNLRILVVDDIPTNVKLTVSILRRLGYSAETASDGNEAVALVEREEFDLIFMDILMPQCDGIEATKRIRAFEQANPSRPAVKIIALTADAFPENKSLCLEAGMNHFLTKPVRRNALYAALSIGPQSSLP